MNKKKFDLLKKEELSPIDDFFDVPFDLAKLPSRGLIYPANSPLANKQEVEFRAMGPIQENILASEALVKNGTVSSVLVKSCLVDQKIDVTSLVLGDKAALMLAIRISGFGHEYKANTRCPACGERFDHQFDLRNCPIKFLDEEPVSPNTNLFEFILPKSKKTVLFSLLTDQDDLDIMKTQKQRKKAVGSDVSSRPTDELLSMIKSIDGKDDKQEIAKFVMTKMSIYDSRALKEYAIAISPGIDLEEEVTCIHCSETDLHRVPMTSQFFFPTLASN